MKNFYPCLLATLIGISLSAQQKQNVIFIVVDDLSIDLATYGNSEVPTPNISRLASHGVLFTQAYCQYSLCSPSRTSALSGRRPDATQVYDNNPDIRIGLGADFKFMPEYFDLFGYQTEDYAKVGPCGHENEVNWDYSFNSKSFAYTSPADGPYWCIDTVHADESENIQGTSTTAFINNLRQGIPTPYFMALGLSTHSAFTPTLDAWNMVGDETVSTPLQVSIYGDLDNVFGNGSSNISLPGSPIGDTLDIPDPALTVPKVYSDEETRKMRHAFYAEIVQLDQQIGRLLNVMDSLHTWDSSVVVFWSDHGLNMGEHEGQWLKHNLFEESLRIPFIVCAPGYKPGVCNRPVEAVDLFPTLTELCNVPQPDSLEGTSLVPLLEKPEALWKKAIFAQVLRKRRYNVMGRAVRNERFHYNEWPGYGEELYDIVNDPSEITNLATNPAWQDSLNVMRAINQGGWENAKPPAYQKSTWYKDSDGDGYGNNTDSVFTYFLPAGYAAVKADCDDNNSRVNPASTEKRCNGIDDNCNNAIDENKKIPVISKRGNLDICTTDSVFLYTTQFLRFRYQWMKNGIVIPGATSFGFMVKEPGLYTVEVTVAGCSSTSLPATVINSCAILITSTKKQSSFHTGRKG